MKTRTFSGSKYEVDTSLKNCLHKYTYLSKLCLYTQNCMFTYNRTMYLSIHTGIMYVDRCLCIMSYAHGFPSSMYPKAYTRTLHFLEGGSWNLWKLFAWIFNCYYGKKSTNKKREKGSCLF